MINAITTYTKREELRMRNFHNLNRFYCASVGAYVLGFDEAIEAMGNDFYVKLVKFAENLSNKHTAWKVEFTGDNEVFIVYKTTRKGA